MAVYISPEGKPESHKVKPKGYFTKNEWINSHPDILSRFKDDRVAEISKGFDDIDKRLVRPIAEILSNSETEVDRTKISDLMNEKSSKRDIIKKIIKAKTVEDIEKICPKL